MMPIDFETRTMKQKPKNIILTGIKHSGKSTFGRIIASKLDYAFFDLDVLIEELNGGRSVRDIFRQDGEQKFRNAETAAAAVLSAKMDNGRACAALGGSTVENPGAMELLKPKGVFVYLYLKPDTLFERVMKTGVPPFLSLANPYDDFKALYRQRNKSHKETADFTIELIGLDVEEGANRILNALKYIIV